MNILVDLLFIVPGRNRGTETYVESLLAELRTLPDTNIVCLTNRVNHSYFQDELGFQCYASPIDGRNRVSRLIYQQVAFGTIAKRTKADVLFCPGYLAPVFPTLPTVVTIHDMNFRDIPSMQPDARWVHNMMIPRVVRSVSQIITVSQFSKKRIIETLDVAGDKIAVVYEGPLADLNKVVESDWQAVKRKYAVRDECFLSVSSGLPHKNVERLVHGFVEMKKKCPGDHQLVLVGHELDDGIKTYLEQEAFRDDVIATGFVSKAEKLSFLKNSIAYFHPSLYEGFGLPALEAQSCGLPLAASKYASIPEVCGEGAIYFDAKSIDGIANAFLDLLNNQGLRERLIRKGYENVSRFSWRQAAIETLALLRDAAKEDMLRTWSRP